MINCIPTHYVMNKFVDIRIQIIGTWTSITQILITLIKHVERLYFPLQFWAILLLLACAILLAI